MRRLRVWLAVAAGVLVVVGATLPWTLPPLLRWLIVRQLRETTGRQVSIERVDVDLRRLAFTVHVLRVAGRPGEPPSVEIARVQTRLRLADVLRGQPRVLLNAARIERPTIRLARLAGGGLDIQDVVDRVARPGRSGGLPVQVTLPDLLLEGGTLVFEDRTLSPPLRLAAEQVTLALRDVSTDAAARPGHGELALVVGGAPARLVASELHLLPFQVRATVTVAGLDLEPFQAYVPAGGLRPGGGRLTLKAEAAYDQAAGARLDLDLEVAEPRLLRRGQREPYVTAPALTASLRGLVSRPGALEIGRFEVAAEPSVVETSGPAPRRLDVRPLRLVVERLRHPAGPPAALTLAAGLPGGATLDARGTVTLVPAAASLDVTLAALDVALLHPFLPADPAVAPDRGRLDARLALRYTLEHGLGASGEARATGLVLRRRGQAEPFATHRQVRLTVDDLAVNGGGLAIGRLRLAGAPRLVDASVSPPVETEFRDLALTAEGVRWPAEAPARVALAGTTTDGGRLAIDGSVTPATLSTRLRVRATGVNLGALAAYVPADAPVRAGHGRLAATLDVGYAAPILSATGDLAVTDLTLLRRGQAEPFVNHPRLEIGIRGLTYTPGPGAGLALRRLTLDGSPTLTDASVTPPVRATFTRLALVADGFGWPARRPTRLRIEAAADGGTGVLEGTFHPATLAADVRAHLVDVDVSRAGPYVPPAAGLAVARGRLGADLRLRHDRATGLSLDGNGVLSDLALTRREVGDALPPPDADPWIADQRLAFTLEGLTWRPGAFGVGRLLVAGAPSLADPRGPAAPRVALRGVRLVARDVAVPGRAPGRVELAAELPESGALAVQGTVAPDGRALDLTVALQDAALDPYRGWLPIDAALGGRVDAALDLTARFAERLRLDARGTASGRDLVLGPPGRAPVGIGRIDVTGIDARWPDEVTVARVALAGLRGLVERERDGSFPLRAMLRPRTGSPAAGDAEQADRAGPASPAGPATPAAGGGPAPDSPAGAATAARSPLVRIGEVVVDDGELRFVDRATEPFYSEEITRLALRVRGLSTAPEDRADLAVQGVVGNTATLDLGGQVAPFARPFVLDLEGELREFPLPRTNPYFRRLFDWFLKRGSLTTRVHYRIVGDQLEAQNTLHLRRLGVERDPTPAESDRKIGLPLGLIVAIATDARGDIRFDLPVKGRLGSPEFSFGSAVWAALKNALVNIVTGPLQAIGSLFGKGETEEVLKVDPVTFPPGSATLTADASRHLQRVADFLRASPQVTLTLRPVVGAADLESLKTREVTARIQRLQREAQLDGFPAAAARAFRDAFPERTLPREADEMVEALREREETPEVAARELAARRVAVTREALVERAGVEAGRLRPAEPLPLGADGEGAVRLDLTPEAAPSGD